MYTYLIPWCKAATTIAPVVGFAWLCARLIVSEPDAPARLVAGLLSAFGLVVAVGGLLGWIGIFSYSGYFVGCWIAFVVLILVYRRFHRVEQAVADLPAASWPVIALGMISLTLLAGSLAARLVQPSVSYDELTYHLHFPVQWLNAARIYLIDTPFGDAAPAYAPAHGELWLAWLMAPFFGSAGALGDFKLCGVDALARVGQFPFFVLAAVSLLVLARELGARSSSMYLPAVLLPFSPWLMRQAATAGVDLMMSACLLAALATALRFRRDGRRANAALCGAALGLAVGAKFVALVYSAVLLPAIGSCLFSRRDAKAIGLWLLALCAFGLPWLLRNLVVAGNPLFPSQFLFFDGAYSRQAMLASPFHAPNVAAALAVSAQAIGFWLAPLGVGGAIAALVLARRRALWRLVAWIVPIALLCHFVLVPYSSQDRFLMWVVALALLPFAFWPATRRGRLLLLVLVPSLALTLWGPGRGFRLGELPVSGRGMLSHDGWWIALIIFAALTLVWILSRRVMAHPAGKLVVVFLAGLVPAVALAAPRSGVFIETGLHAITDLPFKGYVAVWERHPAVVAYAGRNAPYYLAGRDGRTRVVYINTDGRAAMRLHDYVRELAQAGQLDRTKEKADWRGGHPDYDRWRLALLASKAELLFLEPLGPAEKSYLPHDADGYTIERQWARGRPDAFNLVAADADFELYAVLRP